jgi:MFS family permease
VARRVALRLLQLPALRASVRVWAATLLGFLAVGAVLPVLPRYVQGPVGAGDVAVGIVIGAFAFSAVLTRPLAGRLADERGRRAVMLLGFGISAAAGALLALPLGVPGLVAARLVLGVGDALLFTAGAAWIVDLAPPARRGQAIGLFGLAIWGGLAAGPVCGELLLRVGSFEAVWAFAAVMPLLGALSARRLPEAQPGGRSVPADRGPLVPRPVIPPGIALALANVGYGTMAGFVVLHLDDAGIGGGASVFTAFAVAVVGARLAGGRLPDRLGPRTTAMAAGAAETAGLALLALAPSFPVALAGALLMGCGFSLLFPSLALIAVTRVGPERRGSALGAFTAFFDAGVGLGAPLAGVAAALAGYPAAFWLAAAAALASTAVAAGMDERGPVGAPPPAAQGATG